MEFLNSVQAEITMRQTGKAFGCGEGREGERACTEIAIFFRRFWRAIRAKPTPAAHSGAVVFRPTLLFKSTDTRSRFETKRFLFRHVELQVEGSSRRCQFASVEST